MKTNDQLFDAALQMIQVTPENYTKLNTNMILKLCEVIAEAEKKLNEPTSSYGDSDAEIITS